MSQFRATFWMLLLTSVLFFVIGPGCDKKPKKPPVKVIKLRVVMFVETGANLDNPPAVTGGCKFTKDQVKELVKELVRFGSTVRVKFDWNPDAPDAIFKLESDCLKIVPPPVGDACDSTCGLPGVQFNCPRYITADGWFAPKVVNQGPGGDMSLQQHDDYDNDNCTLNIYFIGNAVTVNQQGQTIHWRGLTQPESSNPNIHDMVIIMDKARGDPAAPAGFTDQKNARTLIHEVVCHWLTGGLAHVDPTSNNPCPKNLCVSGNTYNNCVSQYGGKRPTHVDPTYQNAIDQNSSIQGCGGGS